MHHKRGITAVVGTPPQKAIFETIARLASEGNTHIINCSGELDASTVARIIYQHTRLGATAIDQIKIARPYTCHQLIKLLENRQAATATVVIDLLTLFYAPALHYNESRRQLQAALGHLHQIGHHAPVLLTLTQPATPPQSNTLLQLVQEMAHHIYLFQPTSSNE